MNFLCLQGTGFLIQVCYLCGRPQMHIRENSVHFVASGVARVISVEGGKIASDFFP